MLKHSWIGASGSEANYKAFKRYKSSLSEHLDVKYVPKMQNKT